MNLDLPPVPPVFYKPDTCLADPYPTLPTALPRAYHVDNAADYESEVAIIIGRTCKDVDRQDAMSYVLG
jgi:2-keto-4-pentenoate hydratase/2-oxohepta-3-ene-1,7-dioic acid hydratase in catechol pathway